MQTIKLKSVSPEVGVTKDGDRVFFNAHFVPAPAPGVLSSSKPAHRRLWGTLQEGAVYDPETRSVVGDVLWERFDMGPQELAQHVGAEVTGSIEAVDIVPHQDVETGITTRARTLVVFEDETVEQAVRRYGLAPDQLERNPRVRLLRPALPQGVSVPLEMLAVSGDGQL